MTNRFEAGLVGCLGGSLAAALMLLLRPAPMTAPPIALLNRVTLIESMEKGGEGAERARHQLIHTQEMLRNQGYLVLDAAWVLAAPESLYVDLN